MNTERLANIIVAPRVSEKAATRADLENQHVFSVLKNATKPEIKKAVELMFDVKVIKKKITVKIILKKYFILVWKNINFLHF